jgi:hypothetical protein
MGKVFINYRRDDSIATAGRLHDRLAAVLGRKHVFMDVDQIPAGVDFLKHLATQLSASSVFLAVIGPGWLHAQDKYGRQRLYDPDDYVGIEIVAALNRDILVIPVLVDGARMPRPEELPDDLKPLTRRNAVELRNSQFGGDVDRLIEQIRKVLPAGRWTSRHTLGAALTLAAVVLLATALAVYQYGVLPRYVGGRVLDVVDCDKGPRSANPELYYSGVFVGLLEDAQGKAEVQIHLARNDNAVVGSYLREGLCGKLFGEVKDGLVIFRWSWAGANGRGVALQNGKSLRGTSGFNEQTSGGGAFVLYQR